MRFAVVMIIAMLAGCASSGSSSSGFIVRGSYGIVGMPGDAFTTSGTSGAGRAASIVDGAPVKITDTSGKTLAKGKLTGGTVGGDGGRRSVRAPSP